MRHLRTAWLMAVTILGTVGGSTAGAEPARALVLLQSKGYVHDVVKPRDGGPSVVEEVLGDLGARSGAFTPVFTRDATDLTADALRDVDLVIFYTTGDLPLDVAALAEWVASGGGFVGIHCATDTLKDHPAYRGLIGAAFHSHPWNAGDTVTIRVDDPSHPAGGPYAPKATFQEEIYRFRDALPDEAAVVLSLDREATPKKIDTEGEVPVAWGIEHGDGRVFYTSLGHREDVWRSERFGRHLLGAVAWVLADGTDQTVAEPQAATAARPREPWVFRSVLDHNARMITVALHEDLWLAYDAQDLSLHQAWAGGVELKGAVYDGRHGPQPESKVDRLYFRRSDETPSWQVLADNEPVAVEPRYLGYRLEDGSVTLGVALQLPDAEPIIVRETPEYVERDGQPTLQRRIRVEGLPDGMRLRIPLPPDGLTAAPDSPAARLVPSSGDFTQAGGVIEFHQDGEAATFTTWTPLTPSGGK